MPELTEDPLKATRDESSSDSDSTDTPPSLAPPKTTDLGKRVLFYSTQDKKQKYGVLRYVGSPEFSQGVWCGIELSQPAGKNNGSIHGIRYFVCEPNHGVFVPLAKVELDTSRRSRSRPNSAPGSRNSSLERTRQVAPSLANTASASPKMNPYILQKDLVNRLSTPAMVHKRKAVNPVTSWRQPLKAFATRDVKREETSSSKKNVLSPFRAGGMVKAQSTENLRGHHREKEKTQGFLKVGMPAKKSSSERDLRSSSAGNISRSSNSKTSSSSKPLKKKGRVNSCSDLLDSSGTSSKSSNSDTSSSRKSAEISSSMFSDTSNSSQIWPRTSTPGNRDDQTPDGCSDNGEMSDSHSSTASSSGSSSSSSFSGREVEGHTPKLAEKAFVVTPAHNGLPTPTTEQQKPPVHASTGLETQTNQFVKSEVMSPSLEPCRVASPDGAHSKQRYKNRPSGTATLSHPLTSTLTNGDTIDQSGCVCNGTSQSSNGTSCLSPREFVKSLLGSDGTLVGVSVTKIEELFSEQYKLWHSTQVLLEDKVHQLEKQVKEQQAEISNYQRKLKEEGDYKAKLEHTEREYRPQGHQKRSHQKEPVKVQAASAADEKFFRHTTV